MNEMQNLKNGAKQLSRCLPPCGLYRWLLTEAEKRFGVSREEARKRYGMYSYRQWYNLLKTE